MDGTYTHNIENFAGKVCMLSCKTEDENQTRGLRASSLRCLSAMVIYTQKLNLIGSYVMVYISSISIIHVI